MRTRLLLVDDQEPILFGMKEYFLTKGYEVEVAKSAEEAVRLLETVAFHVAIVDLKLGKSERLEGLDVLKLIRQKLPYARTIALTAYGSAETEAEVKALKVDLFLCKPKPLIELSEAVSYLLDEGSVHHDLMEVPD